MPVFTTEGIIVKRSNFGEADRILTIVTPFKGKIKVVAKGVRRITSRRGGNVELLNKVKIQVFQGKGMDLLTEAESLKTFSKIKNDLMISTYSSHIAELADRLLPEEQPNPQAYNLLVIVLNLLENNPRQIFIRAFEVKLLTVLGFWSLDQVGEVRGVREILEKLQKGSWEEIAQIEVTQVQSEELERILRSYLEKVLESPLRSVKIIQKLRTKS
ncbi:MAG: repair protein RecO protein [Candidatus Daviesbacteria bacterium GW2011_GWA1_41_61]|uniref:DNA repair protein RecO n=1 Tax=Candidatus Daviesbacteria bacterium GW2011_GWA2_40_9 TaxID=1618424 RepID=A0A0G0WFB8_9BACT|nr:MAG: repair protein RecO protein [Candidatus Daviesbacteria bacterium GW2011_GWC1_40_9]KKR82990.1 MAG: repair protein RecO protein [Candidatus Daviesbacteria bacterium GW2011_GWA2_40_9]KKR92916.1 MAG: repair protein RecO protein [Candidatus Daviesbacteria bacterium GW2011_GWB1_41_15]KKS15460.1 MAG: repair protein RecO protein [Candidatus Daviesbacteria bacterium GW2011_GWA1_41_61]